MNDISNTQIHDRSLSWLGTGTPIKSIYLIRDLSAKLGWLITSFLLKYKWLLFIQQVWTQKCAVQKASVDVNISYY